jgi:hypothetical protein
LLDLKRRDRSPETGDVEYTPPAIPLEAGGVLRIDAGVIV